MVLLKWILVLNFVAGWVEASEYPVRSPQSHIWVQCTDDFVDTDEGLFELNRILLSNMLPDFVHSSWLAFGAQKDISLDLRLILLLDAVWMGELPNAKRIHATNFMNDIWSGADSILAALHDHGMSSPLMKKWLEGHGYTHQAIQAKYPQDSNETIKAMTNVADFVTRLPRLMRILSQPATER